MSAGKRAVIVTGASSGIGRAIAERLASEGHDLVLVAAPGDASDLDEVAADLSAGGSGVEALAADVAEEATAKRAVALALERFGRLDWLASNAGIAYFDEILTAPVDHLDHTLRVNVRGMYLMMVESARAMASTGRGGAIACTASTASYVGEEFQVTYNASKGAVAQLVRSMAIDLAPYGIRVNAVAPGWVHTRATDEIVRDPDQWSRHRIRIPLDRPGQPAEMANVVRFLLSDEASYMTGTIVPCDGGMMAGNRYSDWPLGEVEGFEPRPRRVFDGQ